MDIDFDTLFTILEEEATRSGNEILLECYARLDKVYFANPAMVLALKGTIKSAVGMALTGCLRGLIERVGAKLAREGPEDLPPPTEKTWQQLHDMLRGTEE